MDVQPSGETGLRSQASGTIQGTLTREEIVRLGVSFALFGTLVGLVRLYHLESQTLFHVLLLAWLAYPVHALLPLRLRLPFFALLSVGSVGIAFGLGAGAWILGLGVLLIGVCHLPLRFGLRVALLVLAGVVLAAMRVQWLPSGAPPAIWPILGAMFMFRLALYLYSLRYQDAPFSVAHAVAYFFMLPNSCFPLFPVVDYKTFAKGQSGGDTAAVQQAGLRWMLRGIIHLLLYRYVYFQLVVDPRDVQTLGELVRHLLSTYLLYLRVSGQFHLIVGLLLCYGFRLPETHHLYYLASSFTDFWRRINIYWKDFMMKLVYYPSFFRLRRFGDRRAIVLATIPVFAGTWLLHSYQWFWLLGEFPITGPDVLFWGVLAVLVIGASLRETAAPRRAGSRARRWQLARAARTVLTFTVICVLWSLWSSGSVASWVELWSAARSASRSDLLLLASLLVGGLALAGYPWGQRTLAASEATVSGWGGALRPFLKPAAVAGLLLLFAMPPVIRWLPTPAADAARLVKESNLNRKDAAVQHLGYYEHLSVSNRFDSRLWEANAIRPENAEEFSETEANRQREDWLLYDLRAFARTQFLGKSVTVNEWGMRDQAYSKSKPPGTVRIALLGASDAMGWGVGDGETFEAVAERVLDEPLRAGGNRVEILNFAVYGYSLLQQLTLLGERVWAFQPDVVVVVSHFHLEREVLSEYLAKLARRRIEVPDSTIRAIVQPSSAARPTQQAARLREMRRAVDHLIPWVYRRLYDEIVAHGARPLVLSLRLSVPLAGLPMPVRRAALAAGFPILDLSEVMPSLGDAFVIAPYDRHPNAEGHRVLGERFADALRMVDADLFGPPDPEGPQAVIELPDPDRRGARPKVRSD